MVKRLACGSFAVVAGGLVFAGSIGEVRAADFVEDGTLQNGGAVTVVQLQAGAVTHRLIETAPDTGGAIQITITGCHWATPTDVVVNDNAGGGSDTLRFANDATNQATVTFASDANALLPDAGGPLSDGGVFTERAVNAINIPNTPHIQACADNITGAVTNIQVQVRSDGNPTGTGAASDLITVRVAPAVHAAPPVPAVSGWGLAGLTLLLTGMGIVVMRRQRRATGDTV